MLRKNVVYLKRTVVTYLTYLSSYFYLYEIAFLSHQIIICFKKVHFVFSFDVSYNDEAYIFFFTFFNYLIYEYNVG